MSWKAKKHSEAEASFTLVETMIAVGILVTVVMNFTGAVGSSIRMGEYGNRVTHAAWVAKGIMAKITWASYQYEQKEFASLNLTEQPVPEEFCPSEGNNSKCFFSMKITSDDWKLPVIDLIAKQAMGGGSDPTGGMLEKQLKDIFGDELLRVIGVEIIWPEGALTNSVTLAQVLVNQMSLDKFIENQTPPTAAAKPPDAPPAIPGAPGATPSPTSPANPAAAPPANPEGPS
jgi:hypothetical protein